MEIAKDKLYGVKYNTKKNVIEVTDKKNKLKVFLRKNKFILSIIGTTTMLVMLNVILIEKFYSLLITL